MQQQLHYLAVLAFLSLCAPLSQAQTWNAQEKEVIEHLRICWEAAQAGNFDHWVEVCRPTPDYAVWNANQGAPIHLEASHKAGDNYRRTVKVESPWFDHRPILIQMAGDTAVVYFYASGGAVEDGKAVVRQRMRVETFRKVSGKWYVLGGMRADLKRE